MSANNCILLSGRLGRDPEFKTTQGGTNIATFSLAVDRGRKDQQGNWITDWFNCKVFGKQADTANELLRKGMNIAIQGAAQQEKWTDKEGQKRESLVVAVDHFKILDKRDGDQAQRQERQQAPAPQGNGGGGYFDEDDIPPY